MNKIIFFTKITLVIYFSFFNISFATLCKKDILNDPKMDIKMEDDWLKKEEERLVIEEQLLTKHSEYITKNTKPLISESYNCHKGKENCDPLKNCQLHKDIENYYEIEYQIKTDLGIIIAKSHCSAIGKCIGYNDFIHNKFVTATEDRLIDIRKDNAIFYHYFYSAHSKNYEPLFNMTNFHTGSELRLNDMPYFSPDEKFMFEIRSVPKISEIAEDNFPRGYNINIYEMNEYGEYKLIEPDEIDEQGKVISTFLSRNPACGETPHFHSWKSNREIRLSMLPAHEANKGRKAILSYNKKTKKWGCEEDIFPEYKCESYLPNSTKFTSNMAEEQICKSSKAI